MRLQPTPSQTIGPFFAVAVPRPGQEYVVPPGTPGAFWIRGQVRDGAGDLVPDALIETWQASEPLDVRPGDPSSRPSTGFGRSATDGDGWFAVHTVKPAPAPAPVPGAGGPLQAPHLEVVLFARGLLRHLVTRIYFIDEPEANARDPVLDSIADPATRATLIATRTDDGYRFDIRLQGDGETVFFAL